ncbi:MAG: methylenetetrahydrofolate dehydrogenase (NADP+)/methenyltetrahydrofolate cyclohydrolase, partial [Pseudomonadota bacterium]
MTANILDGHAHAQIVIDKVASELDRLPRAPGLAVVLVGCDAASQIYVQSKVRMAERLGLRGEVERLPDDASEADLLARIVALNGRDDIDGILIQLPLPAHIDALRVMAAVDPAKDVDGLHALNAGRLFHGDDALVPCTPLGCLRLIKSIRPDLTGAHAVVIGSSNIVGKP